MVTVGSARLNIQETPHSAPKNTFMTAKRTKTAKTAKRTEIISEHVIRLPPPEYIPILRERLALCGQMNLRSTPALQLLLV
jgi:hypothetical protein